jgi:hypothetical protein
MRGGAVMMVWTCVHRSREMSRCACASCGAAACWVRPDMDRSGCHGVLSSCLCQYCVVPILGASKWRAAAALLPERPRPRPSQHRQPPLHSSLGCSGCHSILWHQPIAPPCLPRPPSSLTPCSKMIGKHYSRTTTTHSKPHHQGHHHNGRPTSEHKVLAVALTPEPPY